MDDSEARMMQSYKKQANTGMLASQIVAQLSILTEWRSVRNAACVYPSSKRASFPESRVQTYRNKGQYHFQSISCLMPKFNTTYNLLQHVVVCHHHMKYKKAYQRVN